MPAYKDHSGMKFGDWTVLRRIPDLRPPKYICRCSCGFEKDVFLCNLMRGYSTKCFNCAQKNKSENLNGKKFNKLTVIESIRIKNHNCYKVQCDCGIIRILKASKVQKTPAPQIIGKYISCGKCNLRNYLKLGIKSGKLTIIKEIDRDTSLAKCDCGNEKIVKMHHLVTNYPSCGCYLKSIKIERAKRLEGITYFYLKVVKFIGMGENKRARYQIKCKCGKQFEQTISYLFQSKSCGCLQKENVLRGSKAFFSKLNEVEVVSMRDLFKSGLYTKKDLAKIYEIRYETVCGIINRDTWKHV